jgi:hypothetical protein
MMKKIILLFLILSIFLSANVYAFNTAIQAVLGINRASSCIQSLSDNFNRGNSTNLGTGWTEVAGDWSIASGQLQVTITADLGILVSTTALGGVTQYGKVKLISMPTGGGAIEAGLVLRLDTSDYDPLYILSTTTTAVTWTAIDDEVVQTSESLTFANGDIFALIVKGTGNNTVVSFWKNPIADIPWSGGTSCTDTAKPCWDNAGDAPDLQFTNNPVGASDSNTGFSVYTWITSGTIIFDDVFAGYCVD